MKSKNIYLSENTNPWFNLAAEDWIFRRMDPSKPILMLYRNKPSVIIGRFQNPWVECHLENMDSGGVLLARRQSGGGTVYHDLGNTNYAFFSGIDDFDKGRNGRIIERALRRMGIPAEANDRSDILVEGRKISGSAFKLKRDRAFHHGTLLINADLDKLSSILHPPGRSILGTGVSSVRSPVINLSEYRKDLSHDRVCDAVIDSFLREYPQGGGSLRESPDIVTLDEAELKSDPEFEDYYKQLSSWEWLYGKTPAFTQTIAFSAPLSGTLRLKVKNGCICEIYSESCGKFPGREELLTALPETRYRRKDVEDVLRRASARIAEDFFPTTGVDPAFSGSAPAFIRRICESI